MTTILENRAAYAAKRADTEARAQRLRDMIEADALLVREELAKVDRLASLPWQPLVSSVPDKRVVGIGNQNGAIYDGEAFQDIAAECLPGWRPV